MAYSTYVANVSKVELYNVHMSHCCLCEVAIKSCIPVFLTVHKMAVTHCTLPTGFGRKDVVEFLLAHGARPDAQDDGGLIPLHNACSFGHSEVVSVLLQHGADPNTRDNWNYTPLHEAAHKGKVAVCIRK